MFSMHALGLAALICLSVPGPLEFADIVQLADKHDTLSHLHADHTQV